MPLPTDGHARDRERRQKKPASSHRHLAAPTPPPSQLQARTLIRTRPTPGRYRTRDRLQPAGHQRRAKIARQHRRTPPGLAITENINGADQAPHAASRNLRGITLPATGHPPRGKKTEPEQDPHKIPTKDRPQTPHQHRTQTGTSAHLRWSETRFVSSRDRTRTYNLPVNRRPVVAGSAPGLSAASPCPACIKAFQD